jgi:hypothetical protein
MSTSRSMFVQFLGQFHRKAFAYARKSQIWASGSGRLRLESALLGKAKRASWLSVPFGDWSSLISYAS